MILRALRPVLGTELPHCHADGSDDEPIVKGAGNRALIHGKHRLHRSTGEEQLLVLDGGGQGVGEARATPLRQLHLSPKVGVRRADVGRRVPVVMHAGRGHPDGDGARCAGAADDQPIVFPGLQMRDTGII